MAEANLGRIGPVLRGAYNTATTYRFYDIVEHGGAIWLCKQTATGVTPAEGAFWGLMGGTSLASLGITATAQQINNVSTMAAQLSRAAGNFNAAQWLKASPRAGITYNVTTGADAQGPFIDYQITGTSPASEQFPEIFNPTEMASIVTGRSYTASCSIEVVSGTWPSSALVRVGVGAMNSSGVRVNQINNVRPLLFGVQTQFSATLLFSDPTWVAATPQILLHLQPSTPLNFTMRIRWLQLDLGVVRRAYLYERALPSDAREALGLPASVAPSPIAAAGVGQWLLIQSAGGGALTLPSGGTWAYHASRYAGGNTQVVVAGVAAGGSLVGAANGADTWFGMAWRIN